MKELGMRFDISSTDLESILPICEALPEEMREKIQVRVRNHDPVPYEGKTQLRRLLGNYGVVRVSYDG